MTYDRKTNGCNRTTGGAEAHAIPAGIPATCRQRTISILDFPAQAQYRARPGASVASEALGHRRTGCVERAFVVG